MPDLIPAITDCPDQIFFFFLAESSAILVFALRMQPAIGHNEGVKPFLLNQTFRRGFFIDNVVSWFIIATSEQKSLVVPLMFIARTRSGASYAASLQTLPDWKNQRSIDTRMTPEFRWWQVAITDFVTTSWLDLHLALAWNVDRLLEYLPKRPTSTPDQCHWNSIEDVIHDVIGPRGWHLMAFLMAFERALDGNKTGWSSESRIETACGWWVISSARLPQLWDSKNDKSDGTSCKVTHWRRRIMRVAQLVSSIDAVILQLFNRICRGHCQHRDNSRKRDTAWRTRQAKRAKRDARLGRLSSWSRIKVDLTNNRFAPAGFSPVIRIDDRGHVYCARARAREWD